MGNNQTEKAFEETGTSDSLFFTFISSITAHLQICRGYNTHASNTYDSYSHMH